VTGKVGETTALKAGTATRSSTAAVAGESVVVVGGPGLGAAVVRQEVPQVSYGAPGLRAAREPAPLRCARVALHGPTLLRRSPWTHIADASYFFHFHPELPVGEN
jgi:hypothetical protein